MGGLVRLPDGRVSGAEAAQGLAKELAGRFTVIYTAGFSAHGAGRRLLAQINENAKAAGHHACFPELTHNEIVGWNLESADRDHFSLVVLCAGDLNAEQERAVEASVELLAGQFAQVNRFMANGPDHLSSVMGLIMFGDLVSAHLAVATGVDPVPIARIDALKRRLG
jgi:glucose/mannose-6-phosphate isomerase